MREVEPVRIQVIVNVWLKLQDLVPMVESVTVPPIRQLRLTGMGSDKDGLSPWVLVVLDGLHGIPSVVLNPECHHAVPRILRKISRQAFEKQSTATRMQVKLLDGGKLVIKSTSRWDQGL